jgi:hypothetical protein
MMASNPGPGIIDHNLQPQSFHESTKKSKRGISIRRTVLLASSIIAKDENTTFPSGRSIEKQQQQHLKGKVEHVAWGSKARH